MWNWPKKNSQVFFGPVSECVSVYLFLSIFFIFFGGGGVNMAGWQAVE